MALKKYMVIWSSPSHGGSRIVKAQNKPDAISRVKSELGGRVKKEYMHHFDAWNTAQPKHSPRYR